MHQSDEGTGTDEEQLGVNEQFGDLMKTAREARGWSQRQLAELLLAVDLKLDPSAITRIERGTRDVKLSEALAIAGILEFGLDSLTYSPAKDFLMREYSQLEMSIRARKALLQAIRQIDRWVNNTDEITEEQLMERRGLSRVSDLYTYRLRDAAAFKRGGSLGHGDGDNYAIYYNDEDFRAKHILVERVIDGILFSEDEFERHIKSERLKNLKNLTGE